MPGSERMSDSMESARLDMILGGLDDANHRKIIEAKFNLYSRSNGNVDFRISIYNEFLKVLMPYVEFDFSEERRELDEQEDRKKFLDQFKSIDWKEVANRLPAPNKTG